LKIWNKKQYSASSGIFRRIIPPPMYPDKSEVLRSTQHIIAHCQCYGQHKINSKKSDCCRGWEEETTAPSRKIVKKSSCLKAIAYDSNFCFDIWRVTNADYLLTYLLKSAKFGAEKPPF